MSDEVVEESRGGIVPSLTTNSTQTRPQMRPQKPVYTDASDHRDRWRRCFRLDPFGPIYAESFSDTLRR